MPRTKIYKSNIITKADGHRYVVEITPASADLLPDPLEYETTPSGFMLSNKEKESLDDDLFGMQKPKKLSVTINMNRLPADLYDYLVNPIVEYDLESEAALSDIMRYISNRDLPPLRLTNIWRLKGDLGDSTLAESAFKTLFVGGAKPAISSSGKINRVAGTHETEFVLIDIARLTLESVLPDYIEGYFRDNYENDPTPEYKEVDKVFDFVYDDETAAGDYESVRVKVSVPGDLAATIQGVAMQVGDKVLMYELHDAINCNDAYYYLCIYHYNGADWTKTRDYVHRTIHAGDLFYVEAGDDAGAHWVVSDAFLKICKKAAPYYFGMLKSCVVAAASTMNAVTQTTRDTTAIYYNIQRIIDAIDYFSEIIYRKYLRSTAVNNIDFKNYLFNNYDCYKQNYKLDGAKGAALNPIYDIYFCAFLKTADHIGGGYLFMSKDDADSIHEHDNAWDFLKVMLAGSALKGLVHQSGNNTDIYFKPLLDAIVAPGELIAADHIGDTLEYEMNGEAIRGATISIRVDGDNRSDHKYELRGSYAEKDYSKKALFHTNPTLPEKFKKGEAEELDPSYEHNVIKGWGDGADFDPRKLVYFDTPAFCTAEIAIRIHSDNTIDDGEYYYAYSNPVRLPITARVTDSAGLKLAIADLQKTAGMSLNTARAIVGMLGRNGSMTYDITTGMQHAGAICGNRYVFNLDIFTDTTTGFSVRDDAIIIEKEIDRNTGKVKLKLFARGV